MLLTDQLIFTFRRMDPLIGVGWWLEMATSSIFLDHLHESRNLCWGLLLNP